MRYSYTADRESFIARLATEGVGVTRARAILASANKIQKIAADECSDEPAYLRLEARKARCPQCQREEPDARTYSVDPKLVTRTDLGSTRGLCPEHTAQAHIRTAVRGTTIVGVDYSGDPRGCCVKLRLASGYGDSFGGDGLFCVPTRRY